MDWFATHSAGILRGSMCEAPDTTQLIWIKLMAMANEAKDPLSGRLEFSKGHPYDRPYIAMICRKSIEELDVALEDFIKDITPSDGTTRITIEADGTIVLNHWTGYQPKKRGKTKLSGDGSKPDMPMATKEKTVWDIEHGTKMRQAMAFRGGQEFPDAAKAGIEVAETLKKHKKARHDGTIICGNTKGGES